MKQGLSVRRYWVGSIRGGGTDVVCRGQVQRESPWWAGPL